MKLSVVIPLYNTEKYIEKCVLSTLQQDTEYQYEVLVINDGSTDSSLEIVEKIAAGNPKVRVLTKENGGVSSARNLGIEEAQGEYIMFIDADDYIEPNVIGSIIEEVNASKTDMLLFGMRYVDRQGNVIPEYFARLSGMNGDEVQTGKEFLRRDKFPPVLWSYIHNTSFLKEYALEMKCKWNEDEEFIPRELYYARRVKAIKLLVYNYMQHGESYTNAYDPEKIFDAIAAMKALSDFADSIAEKDSEGAEIIYRRVSVIMLYNLKQTAKTDLDVARRAIDECETEGLVPLKYTHDMKGWLLNNMRPVFMLYYRLKFHSFRRSKS